MNKSENKRKQFVIIILSVLAVCLAAGLFLGTSTAKGKQDVPAVQDGEGNQGSGKQADAGRGKDATPVPTIPGEMAGQPEGEGERAEGLPTPTEGLTKPEEGNGGSGEISPVPTQTVDDGTDQPEDGKGKEDVNANPESGDAGDVTSGVEEPEESQNPGVADTVPEPSPEAVPTKTPEALDVSGRQEKTDNQSESDSATDTKTDGGKGEELNYRVNFPDEATPPPNPPADGKNTAPVENPDKDGNCRPGHTKPEQEETKKEESPSKGETPTKEKTPSKGESSAKDNSSSKGEQPTREPIYVPGIGWVEYEGENSHGVAPNAGTGDIIGDM